MNIKLSPKVLRWARQRARLNADALAKKVVGQNATGQIVQEWEATGEIAIKWVEGLASATRTAFGFLFLPEPPKDALPVSDFRTVDNSKRLSVSQDLLDVIHRAQLRQDWYRNYLMTNGCGPLPFVGSKSIQNPSAEVAADIVRTLHIGHEISSAAQNWETAFRQTIEAIEAAGILFMRAGYAGGYTSRKLLVKEFRGFALADNYAPLIFINGADAPTAQMFTMSHEIAHIWIGASGVSNLDKTFANTQSIEDYCNRVAAEVLLPLEVIKAKWDKSADCQEEINRLSRRYKVSALVVARRAYDAGFLPRPKFEGIYLREIKLKRRASGGNYYLNEQYQNSKRFSVTLLTEMKSGRTLIHDAMKLLGIKKSETFNKFMRSLKLEPS